MILHIFRVTSFNKPLCHFLLKLQFFSIYLSRCRIRCLVRKPSRESAYYTPEYEQEWSSILGIKVNIGTTKLFLDTWSENEVHSQFTPLKRLTYKIRILSSRKFFLNLSFHEHGKYDAPAMIDRILNITGLSKLLYVGYSMGTTTFFTMMSERPEYNSKVIAFVGLAPAVYLDNVKDFALLTLKTMDIVVRKVLLYFILK